MKRLLTWTFIGFFLVFMTIACGGSKTDVNLRLTHAENKEIEKIYISRLDSLRPIWDSLCVTNHDQMVAHALDSIIKERLEEEALLRGRLQE